MNIIGNKTVLRAVETKDAPLLLSMINDPDTERMLGGNSFPVSLNEQEKWIAGQAGQTDILRCIVTEKGGDGSGLGTVILSDIDRKNGVAQVHIKMGADCRGKGYGIDALLSLVGYAFNEMRLNCIYADVLAYNIPSQKLFAKCGFQKDGELRARVFKDGKYINVFSYSILCEDFKQA